MKAPKQILKTFFKGLGLAIFFFVILVTSLFGFWYLRPNTAQINPELEMQQWDVVADGRHNSNTDMIAWNGSYYLIHASAPYHMGSADTSLLLKKSTDFHNWEIIHTINAPDEDIRDPKFAIIGSRLFIYFLNNAGFMAKPYGTSYIFTEDGNTWSAPTPIANQEGWLFWRPKTNDGITYYVPAYAAEHGKAKLLQSTDGITWTDVSLIYDGHGMDETDCVFLPDGRMLCTGRLEGTADNGIGSKEAGTLLAVAESPYTTWQYTTISFTRLDGSNLFELNGKIYAVARYQPEMDSLFTQNGGAFAKKRTALYQVETDRITYFSDLPSAGDTSYAGVVKTASQIYICYYTSDIGHDYGWLLGMLCSSNIMMVNITVSSFELAAASPLPHSPQLPWGGYIVVALNGVFIIVVLIYIKKRKNKQLR